MNKIILPAASEYQLKQCRIFADYVIDTNESVYRLRGGGNRDKLIEDIYSGKVMECRVFNKLEEDGLKPSPIDFSIYSKRRKTFDADTSARIDGVVWKYHVKSCKHSSKYPNSWLFQKQDKMLKKPDKDALVLCVIKETDEGDSSYCYIADAEGVKLSEPVIPFLRNTKIAIYEKDLNQKIDTQ